MKARAFSDKAFSNVVILSGAKVLIEENVPARRFFAPLRMT